MKKLPTVLLIAILLVSGIAIADGTLADAEKAFFKGDHAKAITILKPLALQGDVWAQGSLGAMYGYGQALRSLPHR